MEWPQVEKEFELPRHYRFIWFKIDYRVSSNGESNHLKRILETNYVTLVPTPFTQVVGHRKIFHFLNSLTSGAGNEYA